jgi:hypothetical protein
VIGFPVDTICVALSPLTNSDFLSAVAILRSLKALSH